jgi:hypothetical protein
MLFRRNLPSVQPTPLQLRRAQSPQRHPNPTPLRAHPLYRRTLRCPCDRCSPFSLALGRLFSCRLVPDSVVPLGYRAVARDGS